MPAPALELKGLRETHLLDLQEYLEEIDGAKLTITVEIEYAPVAGATPNAARWIGVINQVFGPGLRHGVVSVRDIAGTNTPSQHSYGNAVDTFASWPTMDAIFRFGITYAGPLSIRLLILRQTQWYGGSLGTYGGEYHNHVHADFYPQYPL